MGNLSSTPFPFLKIQVPLWKSLNCRPSQVLSSDTCWEVLSFWNLKLAGKDKATQKSNPIKDGWTELSNRRQKRKARERPKDAQPIGTKKKGES